MYDIILTYIIAAQLLQPQDILYNLSAFNGRKYQLCVLRVFKIARKPSLITSSLVTDDCVVFSASATDRFVDR